MTTVRLPPPLKVRGKYLLQALSAILGIPRIRPAALLRGDEYDDDDDDDGGDDDGDSVGIGILDDSTDSDALGNTGSLQKLTGRAERVLKKVFARFANPSSVDAGGGAGGASVAAVMGVAELGAYLQSCNRGGGG